MVEFNPVDSLLSEDILAHLHTIPQHPEEITGTDTEQMIKRNDWESETAVVSDLILSPSIPFFPRLQSSFLLVFQHWHLVVL